MPYLRLIGHAKYDRRIIRRVWSNFFVKLFGFPAIGAFYHFRQIFYNLFDFSQYPLILAILEAVGPEIIENFCFGGFLVIDAVFIGGSTLLYTI